MPLRILDAAVGLMFVVFAALQYNDPDPVRWMAIYLSCAAASFWSAATAKTVRFAVPTAVAIAALVWAATIAPRVVGTPGFPTFDFGQGMSHEVTEETREMFGLLIGAFWMVVLAVRAWKKRRT